MIESLTVAALAMAAALIYSIGAALLAALTLLPASRPAARRLWGLLASEAVILSAGVAPWFLPPAALFVCLLIAAARIGHESGAVHGFPRDGRRAVAAPLAVALPAALAWSIDGIALLAIAAALLAAALAAVLLAERRSFIASSGRFAIFPVIPMMAFAHAASVERFAAMLVLAFLLVEIFDSFSLLGGRLYGRTAMVPRLSPNKTWEGLATGILALLAATTGLVLWLGLSLFPMLIVTGAVAAAAVTGDLLGSAAKRRAGVKDYPPVLAIQGGLLDIMDSWIVAGPVAAGLAALAGWAR